MKMLVRLTALVALMCCTAISSAEGLLMVRSEQSFPETMLALQTVIKNHNYTVSRVQRVDIGLTKSGYKTDKYRLVFYGSSDETLNAVAKYPELTPFLPIKIAIFAEESETVMIALSPLDFADSSNKPELAALLKRWHTDMVNMLDEVSGINTTP